MQFTYPLRVWCQTGPFRERWGLLALGQCDRRAPGLPASDRQRSPSARAPERFSSRDRLRPGRNRPGNWAIPGRSYRCQMRLRVIPQSSPRPRCSTRLGRAGSDRVRGSLPSLRDAERTAGRRPHTSGGAGAPGVSPAHTHQPLGACPRRAVGKGRGRVPRRGAAAPRTCRPSRAPPASRRHPQCARGLRTPIYKTLSMWPARCNLGIPATGADTSVSAHTVPRSGNELVGERGRVD